MSIFPLAPSCQFTSTGNAEVGLVFASVLYSLPFVVQPLHNAFEALGSRPLEVAATLRASAIDRFFHDDQAHILSAGMIGFAFVVLLLLYLLNGQLHRGES